MSDLIVKAGAAVDLLISNDQELNPHRKIILEQNAQLTLFYRITDVATWQEHCVIALEGAGAKVKIRGIMHGKQESVLKYFLSLEHRANHTQSDVEFRGVAEDNSHLVFDGLIAAHSNVIGVVANEQNRNLLLSNTAIIETRPRLEIDSNEVQCHHGATIGDLDENQLFYLMSRGIPEAEARSLLIEAFLRFF